MHLADPRRLHTTKDVREKDMNQNNVRLRAIFSHNTLCPNGVGRRWAKDRERKRACEIEKAALSTLAAKNSCISQIFGDIETLGKKT